MLKAALRIASATTLVIASLTLASPAGASTEPPFPGTSEQIRDTGPCGRTGGYNPSEWAQTTTALGLEPQVDPAAVREDWYWRHDGNTLWRGDTRDPDTRNPAPIFEAGFTPKGTDLTPLAQWIVTGGSGNTAHVSTSCDRWVAQSFATGGTGNTGWVYAIQAPGGIDVNATARKTGIESTFLWNKEIDFPGGIQGRFIQGACQYHWAGRTETGVNIYQNLGCRTNPHFRPTPGVRAALAGASR
jgi:hypothetical protein